MYRERIFHMRKFLVTVLAMLLASMLVSTNFAQTSQVTFYNGETIPLFEGTLAYQDGFSHDSLASYIISSDEAFYSAQYYGERTDSPLSIKLAVLDGYVVWQFDFVDQIVCIDAQDATNAYALPVDGVAYTYIIDDFSSTNVVSAATNVNTVSAVNPINPINPMNAQTTSYVSSSNAGSSNMGVAYQSNQQNAYVQTNSQENYNISSDGYSGLYNGYATYEDYLAAYMTSVNQETAAMQALTQAAMPTVSNQQVMYMGESAVSAQTTMQTTMQTNMQNPIGPVQNLGIIGLANPVAPVVAPVAVVSSHSSDYDVEGYDAEGYDAEGYARNGYDREGYDREGYNAGGYDREGYNREGYNMTGYDREGYSRDGYNAAGYDREGNTR